MTLQQEITLHKLLANRSGEFHHGDCIGSDALAHDLAEQFGFDIIIHPPEKNNSRAFKPARTILKPKPYLERNHSIVDATEELVATPKQDVEIVRSGTWATVRYARKLKRAIYIIWPTGKVTAE